jgi:general secretion pathway protein M
MSRPLSDSSGTPAATALGQQWQAAREALRRRWQALAPREQRSLSWAALAVALLLLWMICLAPAWKTLTTAPRQLAELDTQLARMQWLANEARELRALPLVDAEQARTALQAATARLGSSASLQINGEQAQVKLTAISSAALTAWLTEVRGAARARVVELQLQRQGEGYSGQVVLALSTPN